MWAPIQKKWKDKINNQEKIIICSIPVMPYGPLCASHLKEEANELT